MKSLITLKTSEENKMKFTNFLKLLLSVLLLTAIVTVALFLIKEKQPNNQPLPDADVEAVELTDIGGPFKHWFYRLSNEGKHAYNLILSSIYSMPEEIEINRIDSETLDEVFYALMSDNPDLFFLGRRCTLRTVGMHTFFSVDYTVSKNEYSEMKTELDSVCAEISASFTDKTDLWQTELEIHDYIIDHCDYSLDDQTLGSSSYGALVNGKAACEGYSKAAKLLLDAAGIENTLVTGNTESDTGPSGAHMWNVVKLGGEWYHLDCTWDDPVDETGKKTKNHLYFNVDDASVSFTHSDFSHDFNCNSMKESYFVKTGAYFESYDRSKEAEIAEILIKETKNGKETVYFCFADKKTFDSAVNDLMSNERIYYVLNSARKKSGIAFSTVSTGYLTDEDRFILALAPQIEQE